VSVRNHINLIISQLIAIRGASTVTIPSSAFSSGKSSPKETVIKASELIRHFEECEASEEDKERDRDNQIKSRAPQSATSDKNRRLSREVSLLTKPSTVYHLDDMDEAEIILMAAQRSSFPSLSSVSQLRVPDTALLFKFFRHLCSIYQVPHEAKSSLCNRIRFLLFFPHKGIINNCSFCVTHSCEQNFGFK
jgi:hypothetical protein